ncbi:hypothetical protein B0T21DRAFT_376595 [Apiosordaria backusii]|uniref:Secreted protein n=1 Tax=Apiosordaria backusii TaxID=314023 RepID=A0AA40A748_9PEZI|nr:hypothetical protein B0T21DRAFT_376595 [Apiosordaria backusii]
MKYSLIFITAIGLATAAPTINQPTHAISRRSPAPSTNSPPSAPMNQFRKRSPQSENGSGNGSGQSNRDSTASSDTAVSQQSQSSTGTTLVNPPSTDSESVRSESSTGSTSSGSAYSQDEYQPITREQRQNLYNNVVRLQQEQAAEDERWRQERDALSRNASGSQGESSGSQGRPNNQGNNGGEGGGQASS